MRIFPNLLATLASLMVLAFLFMPAVGTNIYTPTEMLINWLRSIALSLLLLWIVYRIYRDGILTIFLSLALLAFMAISTQSDQASDDSSIVWILMLSLGTVYLIVLLYFRQHRHYRYLLQYKRSSLFLKAQRAGLLLPASIGPSLSFIAKATAALAVYFVLVSLVIIAFAEFIGIEDFPLVMLPIFWFFSLLATQGLAIRPIINWYHDTRCRIAPSAGTLSLLDPRPSVLFLRSFKTDEIIVKGRFRPLLFFFGGNRGEKERLEEVLATETFLVGPVIAVANPTDSLSPLGAARENLADDKWQAYVTDYVDQSQLIVCLVGDTEHFGWEINQIQRQRQGNKTLLVIPPSPINGGQKANLARFFGETTADVDDFYTGELPTNARILVHSPQHQGFVAICSKQITALAYIEALRLALGLRLSL